VGDLDGDRLLVEHGLGGDPHLVTHLAELIADIHQDVTAGPGNPLPPG
jgi:hypothetical protein